MHGRILVDGRDEGGGCALTPEMVVTAAHVVRAARADSRVVFAVAGREAIAVKSVEPDTGLDLAMLQLAESVVPCYVAEAAERDRWTVSAPPQEQDAFLTGTVDVALRDFENDKGNRQQVVQLRVDQELKQFAGYSGSGVCLPTADGAVAAVLTEQLLERTRQGPGTGKAAASNVLFAVPVKVALERFGLTSAAEARPHLSGDTLVENFMSRVLGSAERPVPFGGRAAELRGLDQWAADPPASPRMLVVAPAGSGKSTLLAHWLFGRPAPAAPDGRRSGVVFVPLSISSETAERDVFYRIMTARIARAYRESIPIANRGWDDLLEEQSRLLRRSPPDGTLLIVIDGLDEALGWEPGANMMPTALAPGVRVVASARMTASLDAAGWAARLGWESHATLTPGRLDHAGIIEVMVGQPRLAHHRGDPALDDLAREGQRLSQNGDPLVVGLFVKEIEDRVRDTGTLPESRDEWNPDAWLTDIASRQPGRAGFIAGWREQQARSGRSDLAQDAERLLNVLAVAQGPLSRAELRTLAAPLGLSMDGVRLRRVLDLLERLILPGSRPGTFVIAHPAIAEELRAQLEKDEDMTTYRGLFETWAVDVLGRLKTRELRLDETPRYLVRYLARHLTTGADLHPAVLRLATPYWRRVKDALSEETTGFRNDLETVMAAARRVDAARVARGDPPRLLPERVMCAAEIAGNHQSLAGSMTPALAAEFVRAGLWRPERALSYVDEHAQFGHGADAVVAVAPVVPADQLPEFNRLVRSKLKYGFFERHGPAIAAWAKRLLELRGPAAALDAAAALIADLPSHHGFAEVQVLAELIPYLDDGRAAAALMRAVDVLRETRNEDYLSHAACILTRNVPVRRAEQLWPASDATRPAEALATALGGHNAWEQALARPDRMPTAIHFEAYSDCFVAVARWLRDEERSAFITQGLRLSLGTPMPDPAQWMPDETDLYALKLALMPGLNYDGLLSVLPAADAAAACDWVRRVVSGSELLCCLAQLLPLLDADRRQDVADELFGASAEEFRRLDDAPFLVPKTVPGIVAAGLADRLVDRISSDAGLRRLAETLAPHLTEGQAGALLEALPSGPQLQALPTGSRARWIRNAVLTRRASFGRRQTLEAFDEAYAAGTSDAIDPRLMDMLRTVLSGEHEEPRRAPPLDAWWLDAHAGVYPKGGVRGYPHNSPVGSHDIEAMLDDTDPDPPGTFVDVAFALARYVTAKDVPRLLTRARTLADPWLGLLLLAAGTHLPAGEAADSVTAEIFARLDALRAASPEPSGLSHLFPHGSHWLRLRFSGWAPFFARAVSPAARPAIADRMFAGGYLDGIIQNKDLDAWAADALGLTPLLTHEQLARWEVIAGQRDMSPIAMTPQPKGHIESGTLRSYFYSAIAVGYATCGDFDDAYRVVELIGGPRPDDLRHAVFAELLAMADPGELPGWIAAVHKNVRDAIKRGPLWEHLMPRLHELTDDQMWAVIDWWLAETPKSARTDVFADALMYRYAIARLAGQDECARLILLIEERESLNTPGDSNISERSPRPGTSPDS